MALNPSNSSNLDQLVLRGLIYHDRTVVDGVTENFYHSERSFLVVSDLTIILGGGGALSLFGRGLMTRVMIASLMMSGCYSGVFGQLCAEDEFYDAVVDECALCGDVCDLCLAPESQAFCIRNCPGSTRSENFNPLTLSPPIPLRLYILPYWPNPPFLPCDCM